MTLALRKVFRFCRGKYSWVYEYLHLLADSFLLQFWSNWEETRLRLFFRFWWPRAKTFYEKFSSFSIRGVIFDFSLCKIFLTFSCSFFLYNGTEFGNCEFSLFNAVQCFWGSVLWLVFRGEAMLPWTGFILRCAEDFN